MIVTGVGGRKSPGKTISAKSKVMYDNGFRLGRRQAKAGLVPAMPASAVVGDALASIAVSWLTVRMYRARQQRMAVAAIIELGGDVGYDYQTSMNDSRRRDRCGFASCWGTISSGP